MSVLADSAFAVPTEVKDLPTAISLITRITGDDYNVVLADWTSPDFLLGCAQGERRDHRAHQFTEAAGHSLPEGAEAFLSGARSGGAGARIGRHGGLGQSGIENEFDDELRGRDGKDVHSVDTRKQWFSDVETQPDPGKT